MSDRSAQTNSFIEDSPRLGPEDSINFVCHKDVPCFNECCRDLTLLLTPYDVLRMRKRLNITSEEFIEEYAVMHADEVFNLPMLRLKMLDDELKRCPFVTPDGCSIYEDRPWACRCYPLGAAASKSKTGKDREFFFIIHEDHCKGFEQQRTITVKDWIVDQGIADYDANNSFFKELTMYRNQIGGRNFTTQMQQMFFMACYNLEKFRKFVLESSFLDKFIISDDEVEKLRESDEALLDFSFRWLKFSLFGEKTLAVKNADVKNMRPAGPPKEFTF